MEKSGLTSQLTFLTESLLANCHFSKKGILQIIRNSDSNNTHGVILGSGNVNFNGFQIFDA